MIFTRILGFGYFRCGSPCARKETSKIFGYQRKEEMNLLLSSFTVSKAKAFSS